MKMTMSYVAQLISTALCARPRLFTIGHKLQRHQATTHLALWPLPGAVTGMAASVH